MADDVDTMTFRSGSIRLSTERKKRYCQRPVYTCEVGINSYEARYRFSPFPFHLNDPSLR
jgi:hypothetical protein